MEDTLIIDSVDMLKVYADALRQRILQTFCCNPATTKQAADLLGEKPARLYHHIELLEKHGYLEVVDTQQIRGTVEKYYQTSARKIIVDHTLVGAFEELGHAPNAQDMVINTLQACLVDARDHFSDQVSNAENPFPVIASQSVANLSPEQAQDFIDKVCALVDETNTQGNSEDQQTYTITLTAFPVTATTLQPCCGPDAPKDK